jgi:hypothetical protein
MGALIEYAQFKYKKSFDVYYSLLYATKYLKNKQDKAKETLSLLQFSYELGGSSALTYDDGFNGRRKVDFLVYNVPSGKEIYVKSVLDLIAKRAKLETVKLSNTIPKEWFV